MAVYLGQNQVNLFGGQNVIVDGAELPELDNPGVANDLAMGKQMIDSNGNVVEGAVPVVEDEARYSAYDIWDSDTSEMDNEHVSEYPDCVQILGNIFDDMLIRDIVGMYAYVPKSVFGDAQPSDVAKGKTFTSSGGVRVEGTMEAPSGGMVMKSGAVTDNTTINTGLSSVVFFILYDTSIASQGLLSTMKDVTNSVNATTYCSSYTAYMKTYSNATTELLMINGGTVTYGGTGSQGMISGNEYRWVAFGTE